MTPTSGGIASDAAPDAFDADHWWRDTADAWALSREWFGLLNAWAGFPLRSEHW